MPPWAKWNACTYGQISSIDLRGYAAGKNFLILTAQGLECVMFVTHVPEWAAHEVGLPESLRESTQLDPVAEDLTGSTDANGLLWQRTWQQFGSHLLNNFFLKFFEGWFENSQRRFDSKKVFRDKGKRKASKNPIEVVFPQHANIWCSIPWYPKWEHTTLLIYRAEK